MASAGNRFSQATISYALEKWSEAKSLLEGLLKERLDNVDYLGNLGAVLARMGDREAALEISRKLEEDKRPYLRGNPTYWRARIASVLGDKEGAVNLLRLATKQGYYYYNLHPNEDFESLADYPPFVQFMKPKG